jgi:diguanylate cyclase (GGDEF)-like protein
MVDEMVRAAPRRGLGRGLHALLPPRPERPAPVVHDALTGLPGHDELVRRIEEAVAVGHQEDTALAVVVLGLDRFRRVNRAYGHDVGDVVLRQLGARLAGGRRAGDVVARLGGDEFALLCPMVRSAADATLLVARLQREIERAMVVDGTGHRLTATAGVVWTPAARAPRQGRELVRRADLAMQRAKDDGVPWAVAEPVPSQGDVLP